MGFFLVGAALHAWIRCFFFSEWWMEIDWMGEVDADEVKCPLSSVRLLRFSDEGYRFQPVKYIKLILHVVHGCRLGVLEDRTEPDGSAHLCQVNLESMELIHNLNNRMYVENTLYDLLMYACMNNNYFLLCCVYTHPFVALRERESERESKRERRERETERERARESALERELERDWDRERAADREERARERERELERD